MEMEFSKIEKMAGAFIISTALLLIASLVVIGRGKDWFETYIIYYTTFNESYNLQENAAVKLFKADIGKIKKITLTKDGVRVKLAILEQYAPRIRKDSIAVVESPTFIGSEYISILPGSVNTPAIAENGEIASREKRSVAEILSEFEVEKTAKMAVKAIQDISEVARILSAKESPLWRSLNRFEKISGHVEQITSDLETGKGPMGALLQSESLLQSIVAGTQRMENILGNIDRAAAKAPNTLDLVQDNLDTYRHAGQLVTERIEQTRLILADIQKAVASLQVTLENIKTGSSHIPKISTTFRDGIQEIRDGVEQIDRVVDSMQKNVFIRSNLPAEPVAGETRADSRPD